MEGTRVNSLHKELSIEQESVDGKSSGGNSHRPIEEFLRQPHGLQEIIFKLKSLRNKVVIDRALKKYNHSQMTQIFDILKDLYKIDHVLLICPQSHVSPARLYLKSHDPVLLNQEGILSEIRVLNLKLTDRVPTDLTDFKPSLDHFQQYLGKHKIMYAYRCDNHHIVNYAGGSQTYLFLYDETNPFQVFFKEYFLRKIIGPLLFFVDFTVGNTVYGSGSTELVLDTIEFVTQEILRNADSYLIPFLLSTMNSLSPSKSYYFTQSRQVVPTSEISYIKVKDSSKPPQLISVKEDNGETKIDLKFKIIEGWANARHWLNHENTSWELTSLISKSKGLYLLCFDKLLNLVYINTCLQEHVGSLFSSNIKEISNGSLHLEAIFSHQNIKANISNLIEWMIKNHEVDHHLENPDLRIKITYSDHNKPEHIYMMLYYSSISQLDDKWSVNFILQHSGSMETGAGATDHSNKTIPSPKSNEIIGHYKKVMKFVPNSIPKIDNRDAWQSNMNRHRPRRRNENSASESPDIPVAIKERGRLLRDKKKKFLISAKTINFDGRLNLQRER